MQAATVYPNMTGADQRTHYGQRIRIMAIAIGSLALAMTLVGRLLFPPSFGTNLQSVLGVTLMLLSAVAYWLRETRLATVMVYATLLAMCSIIAAIDPLEGTVGTATWTLYQLIPPIGALVFRSDRHVLTLAGIVLALMIGMALLQVQGIIPIQLLVKTNVYYYALAVQIIVMMVIATCIITFARLEQRSAALAIVAQQTALQRLGEVEQLLRDKEALNAEISQSIAAIQYQQNELRNEQAQRNQLARTVRQLATPVVPVARGVVVTSLIGEYDTERLEQFTDSMLTGIEKQRAKALVIDVTGVDTIDTQIAKGLIDAVRMASLLGVRSVLVGVHPEIAQTIVSLGVDLSAMETRADLQDGIAWAIRFAKQR